MGYLGVPIVIAIYAIFVCDEDYLAACQKLENAGYTKMTPNRGLSPDEMAELPDAEQANWYLTRGYKRVDELTTSFKTPDQDDISMIDVVVVPNSFAHLPLDATTSDSRVDTATVGTAGHERYNNIAYPLEAALVESFVKAVIDDEDEDGVAYPTWGGELNVMINHMGGYLEVNNDILGHSNDARAVEWYSTKFGRIREAKFGPWDNRVTKRLGSGKEMPVDMKGNPLPK